MLNKIAGTVTLSRSQKLLYSVDSYASSAEFLALNRIVCVYLCLCVCLQCVACMCVLPFIASISICVAVCWNLQSMLSELGGLGMP